MLKLDKQNRLRIPKKLMKSADTNFEKEVKIYRHPHTCNEFYLDNSQNSITSFIYDEGTAKIDNKGYLYFDEILQDVLNIFPSITYFSIYLQNGKVTFKTILSLEE